MSRAHPTDPDTRRAQLLQAGREVFGRKGYHAANVSDIIETAGVARGTFYNYFSSKRAIFQAVLQELMEAVTHAVTPIDINRPIPPQVRDNLCYIVSSLQELGDGARILFSDAAGIDAEGTEAMREFYGAATQRIARALQTGQQMGLVREGDTQITASCLLGMLKEPVFQGLLRGQAFDVEGVVEAIFALVGAGLLQRS